MSWAEVKTALNSGNPADSDYKPLNEQITALGVAGAIGSVKSVQRGRFSTHSLTVDTTNGAYFNISISSSTVGKSMVIIDGVAFTLVYSISDKYCLPSGVSGGKKDDYYAGVSKVSNVWGYLQSSEVLRIHIPWYESESDYLSSMYAKGTYQVIEFY